MGDRVLEERVRETLGLRGVGAIREVSMFGGRSFMVNDRLTLGSQLSGLLVRIDPARAEELRAAPGAEEAVMGNGRRMGTNWIRVDISALDTDEALDFWVDVALEFNAGAR